MEIAQLIIEAFKFIFPAYCANAVPVLAGGGHPLDLGRNFLDGRPIFGKNKTFRGFFSGLAVGIAVGLLESVLFQYPIFFGLLVSFGALLGDLAGAFLKRRLGMTPGQLLPIVDQIDFILGAILLSLPAFSAFLSVELALAMLVVTPPVHLLTNFAAYRLGLKSNPW